MENKAILMSIRPQYVAKILNGEKTIEVRKKFPKDYVGWVYIYCTKAMPNAHIWTMKVKEKPYKVIFSKTQYQQETDLDEFMNVEFIEKYPQYAGERIICHPEHINGYVVARFWCEKVEEIYYQLHFNGFAFETNTMSRDTLNKKSCLTDKELREYFSRGVYTFNETYGYAIHISKLEVFDKPKELKDFYKVGAEEAFKELEANLEEFKGYPNYSDCGAYYQTFGEKYRLQSAPQSFQFIEGEND